MPFSVVYDACVLHPAPLRDLLMRIARRPLRAGGLVQSAARLNELLGELPSASAPLA